jgi:hypothetical protein
VFLCSAGRHEIFDVLTIDFFKGIAKHALNIFSSLSDTPKFLGKGYKYNTAVLTEEFNFLSCFVFLGGSFKAKLLKNLSFEIILIDWSGCKM